MSEIRASLIQGALNHSGYHRNIPHQYDVAIVLWSELAREIVVAEMGTETGTDGRCELFEENAAATKATQ